MKIACLGPEGREINRIPSPSTSSGVLESSKEKCNSNDLNIAAIGSKHASDFYGVPIVEPNIQNIKQMRGKRISTQRWKARLLGVFPARIPSYKS